MKTKNNNQKTALKAVAAATGLAILSLTVNAQGVLKSFFENDGTEHIAMVMENTNNSFAANNYSRNFTSAETFAAYLEAETEEPLNVEDWMVDEDCFTMSAELETETETPLEIEDWMTSESTFGINSAYIETETEKPLQLEDWMVNETNFTTVLQIETESPMEVEDWMTDETKFGAFTVLLATTVEEELNLEAWMLNENLFYGNENSTTGLETINSKVFSTSTFFFKDVVIENKLIVEDWMTNTALWVK
jgi:hypothetical protein